MGVLTPPPPNKEPPPRGERFWRTNNVPPSLSREKVINGIKNCQPNNVTPPPRGGHQFSDPMMYRGSIIGGGGCTVYLGLPPHFPTQRTRPSGGGVPNLAGSRSGGRRRVRLLTDSCRRTHPTRRPTPDVCDGGIWMSAMRVGIRIQIGCGGRGFALCCDQQLLEGNPTMAEGGPHPRPLDEPGGRWRSEGTSQRKEGRRGCERGRNTDGVNPCVCPPPRGSETFGHCAMHLQRDLGGQREILFSDLGERLSAN